MPRSADETKRLLLDAAERRFAADGIMGATFADIIEDSGQRNNSAIQYHFGDRIGLLEAVTERRVRQMAVHRARLLDRLPADPDLRQVTEVIVLPLAALLSDPGGAAYLRIQAELLAHPARDTLPPMLAEPWSRPGLERAVGLLVAGLPEHSRSLGSVRRMLAVTLIFHALADRARTDSTDGHDDFVRGLIVATVAILETPVD